jgi:hypothetical protein
LVNKDVVLPDRLFLNFDPKMMKSYATNSINFIFSQTIPFGDNGRFPDVHNVSKFPIKQPLHVIFIEIQK